MVLALAAIMAGSAALYGLAEVSAEVSKPTSSIVDGWMRGDHDATAGTSGFRDNPLLRIEAR